LLTLLSRCISITVSSRGGGAIQHVMAWRGWLLFLKDRAAPPARVTTMSGMRNATAGHPTARDGYRCPEIPG